MDASSKKSESHVVSFVSLQRRRRKTPLVQSMMISLGCLLNGIPWTFEELIIQVEAEFFIWRLSFNLLKANDQFSFYHICIFLSHHIHSIEQLLSNKRMNVLHFQVFQK
ncbi:unnamed protein product [Citrullus colocynthis]|uniref:Uncharacterized protein n=1 Tax=Citrullus colocynthis TaxID=252529 RepID=A0ABP0Y654_9ROSI